MEITPNIIDIEQHRMQYNIFNHTLDPTTTTTAAPTKAPTTTTTPASIATGTSTAGPSGRQFWF